MQLVQHVLFAEFHEFMLAVTNVEHFPYDLRIWKPTISAPRRRAVVAIAVVKSLLYKDIVVE